MINLSHLQFEHSGSCKIKTCANIKTFSGLQLKLEIHYYLNQGYHDK